MLNTMSRIDHEWDLFECKQCAPKKHTIFLCPKLHYMPYKSVVIDRHLLSPSLPQPSAPSYKRHQNRIKRKFALNLWKMYFKEYEKKW